MATSPSDSYLDGTTTTVAEAISLSTTSSGCSPRGTSAPPSVSRRKSDATSTCSGTAPPSDGSVFGDQPAPMLRSTADGSDKRTDSSAVSSARTPLRGSFRPTKTMVGPAPWDVPLRGTPAPRRRSTSGKPRGTTAQRSAGSTKPVRSATSRTTACDATRKAPLVRMSSASSTSSAAISGSSGRSRGSWAITVRSGVWTVVTTLPSQVLITSNASASQFGAITTSTGQCRSMHRISFAAWLRHWSTVANDAGTPCTTIPLASVATNAGSDAATTWTSLPVRCSAHPMARYECGMPLSGAFRYQRQMRMTCLARSRARPLPSRRRGSSALNQSAHRVRGPVAAAIALAEGASRSGSWRSG